MKVIWYPARLEAELSAPDVALISIYRALGGATRLRILRHPAKRNKVRSGRVQRARSHATERASSRR